MDGLRVWRDSGTEQDRMRWDGGMDRIRDTPYTQLNIGYTGTLLLSSACGKCGRWSIDFDLFLLCGSCKLSRKSLRYEIVDVVLWNRLYRTLSVVVCIRLFSIE